VAIEGLPDTGAPVGAVSAESVRTWSLVVLTLVGWTLVGTMRYWWSWLWVRLGLLSVPVDTLVWIIAIILTILLTPVLWRRFRRVGVVTFVIGSLLVGGTAIVLSPWHDVLSQAWMRMECGPGDCAGPPPVVNYSWRVEKPK
jgi:hypothetical protein